MYTHVPPVQGLQLRPGSLSWPIPSSLQVSRRTMRHSNSNSNSDNNNNDHIYIYIYIHICTYMYAHICMHIHIYIYMYICVYIYIYMCTHTFMYMHHNDYECKMGESFWEASNEAKRHMCQTKLCVHHNAHIHRGP